MKTVKLFALLAVSALVMSFSTLPHASITYGVEFKNYDGSSLLWKSEEIDLGNIPQGKPVTVKFEFTNKGKDAVIITSVTTSCGCTVADYSKKPIGVNEKSVITATYNASGLGAFTKAVTVNFANNETKVLNIKGTVVKE